MIKLIVEGSSEDIRRVCVEESEDYSCDFCDESEKEMFSNQNGNAICNDCIKQLYSFIKPKKAKKKAKK